MQRCIGCGSHRARKRLRYCSLSTLSDEPPERGLRPGYARKQSARSVSEEPRIRRLRRSRRVLAGSSSLRSRLGPEMAGLTPDPSACGGIPALLRKQSLECSRMVVAQLLTAYLSTDSL